MDASCDNTSDMMNPQSLVNEALYSHPVVHSETLDIDRCSYVVA